MQRLNTVKFLLCLLSCAWIFSAQASTSTGSEVTGASVNVTFKVKFIQPPFDVTLPTLVDFGNTLVGQRVRLDVPFSIRFAVNGTPYKNFRDAPNPVEIFAQNLTQGAQDTESMGNMQEFFYLGCDNSAAPTKITTTSVQLDTQQTPINDLSTCKLYLDTNPEAPPGRVNSTLNFIVQYP